MSFINPMSPTPLVGEMTGNQINGFKQMMVKLQESFSSSGTNLNYLTNFNTILEHKNLSENYMEILMEDYDSDFVSDQSLLKESANADLCQNLNAGNYTKLQALMQNSCKELLQESQQTGSLLPVVGLTLPLLKLYWIKNVWKDLIPTAVTPTQSFMKGIEREYVMGPDKVKHYLPESFKEGLSLFSQARQKLSTDPIPVPATDFDLITAAGGSVRQDDQVSRNFHISYIKYEHEGDTKELDKLRIRVRQDDGSFVYPIKDEDGKTIDTLIGTIDFETGMLNVPGGAKIKEIKVDGSLSSENNVRTMSVGWDKDTKTFVVPDTDHFGTGLTKERIKDENVIYNIDSTTKVTQQMVNVIGVKKDMEIQDFLDRSKDRIEGTDLFIGTKWSVKPPASTMKTPTEWRIELKETLDNLCIKLAKVLQLEDIMFTVVGSQENVKLLDSVQWMYGKDSEVGGCKIGYNIGLYNGQRNFRIASSDRIDDDRLRIFVYPTSGDYMMYELFEYQFVITNEYRVSENLRVPSVCVFDRYLVDELIPIQGSISIADYDISSSEIYNH